MTEAAETQEQPSQQEVDRQKLRAALLVAIVALGKERVQLDGRQAKVLADGFALVREEGDPDLGFEERKPQTMASRIMGVPATPRILLAR